MLLQVGTSQLSHEVLTAFMAEDTAIVNARLLVSVSADPDSPLVLTSAILLTQKVGTPSSPPGDFDFKDLYKRQWRRVQSLANTFWVRWRCEYLVTIQSHRKWQSNKGNIQEGDLVLLKDSQVKQNEWPYGQDHSLQRRRRP